MWTDLLKPYVEIYLGKSFMSEDFRVIMDKKLWIDFKDKTKIIKRSTRINLGMDGDYYYRANYNEQALKIMILVNNTGFYAVVKWKNKSEYGRAIRPFNTNIDENSFDMWFEDLPVEGILKEFYKNPPQLRIDTSSLTYNLITSFFFHDSTYLVIKGAQDTEIDVPLLLGDAINAWNEKSEKLGRENGVMHNSRLFKKEENQLIFYVDLGSSGEDGLLMLLNELSKLKNIEEVKITSFV